MNEAKTDKKDKILILSCGTGGGHNTAARAIEEELNLQGIEAKFLEYLDIVSPKVRDRINKLYIKSTSRNGKTFKVIYKLGEKYQKTNLKSPIYALNMLSKNKLYNYIKENEYNYIVTTHLFAAQALTELKKDKKVGFIAIATDYVSIPFWEETNPDYFIIPNEDLKKDFIEKGIDEKKLKPLGIPTKKAFREEYDIFECREKLNLDKNKKYILVLTGSMGFGSVEKMVKSLEEKIKNVKIIVSCGTNKKLKETLEKSTGKKVHILPYTNNIDLYIKSCDVILSKPGGLTTTEIATIRKPFIHTMPIPGCETYNAEFFAKRKMSIKCENIEEIIKGTKILLEDEEKKKELIKNQEKYINKNATVEIVELIKNQMKLGV